MYKARDMYIRICIYVRINVCMYVCMHACMYVCMYVRVCTCVCVCVCVYVRMYAHLLCRAIRTRRRMKALIVLTLTVAAKLRGVSSRCGRYNTSRSGPHYALNFRRFGQGRPRVASRRGHLYICMHIYLYICICRYIAN